MSQQTEVQIGIDPEFDQYEDLAGAIDGANGIRAEYAGQVPGMLRAYIQYARGQAVSAVAALVSVNPSDPVEILKLQKTVAGYAHVMGWVQDQLSIGDAAEVDWEDTREFMKQQEEPGG